MIYKKTFENVKVVGYDYPIEDQYWASEKEAIVVDGITRDPVGVSDLFEYTQEENIKRYPRPSGAELAAKEIVKTFSKTNGDLRDRLITCNKSVKILNDKCIKECDYLQNDYYGAVASCIRIDGNILNYAYICNCGVIVYDKFGNIRFKTVDEKELISEPYILKIGIPWNLPESRVIVRRDYRNNLNNIQDGKCVAFGALTGEKAVEEFIRTGSIELETGDIIIIYSDGLVNYLTEQEFINNIINFNEETFEEYINRLSKVDVNKYGREKTIVMYKLI